jgi:hypothetical protein
MQPRGCDIMITGAGREFRRWERWRRSVSLPGWTGCHVLKGLFVLLCCLVTLALLLMAAVAEQWSRGPQIRKRQHCSSSADLTYTRYCQSRNLICVYIRKWSWASEFNCDLYEPDLSPTLHEIEINLHHFFENSSYAILIHVVKCTPHQDSKVKVNLSTCLTN